MGPPYWWRVDWLRPAQPDAQKVTGHENSWVHEEMAGHEWDFDSTKHHLAVFRWPSTSTTSQFSTFYWSSSVASPTRVQPCDSMMVEFRKVGPAIAPSHGFFSCRTFGPAPAFSDKAMYFCWTRLVWICVEEYVILFVAESPKSHVIVDSNVELLYLSESTVISPNDHKTVLPLHPIFWWVLIHAFRTEAPMLPSCVMLRAGETHSHRCGTVSGDSAWHDWVDGWNLDIISTKISTKISFFFLIRIIMNSHE